MIQQTWLAITKEKDMLVVLVVIWLVVFVFAFRLVQKGVMIKGVIKINVFKSFFWAAVIASVTIGFIAFVVVPKVT
jgi:hypothetical protein